MTDVPSAAGSPAEPTPEPTAEPASAGELRLAVVMNGGVSLAIWMGGVAHELDLLRRASTPEPVERQGDVEGSAPSRTGRAAVPGYDRSVFDAWRSVVQRRHLGAVLVDVIAGTSAGGLNGALLATAAARGSSLDPPREDESAGPFLRQVWESKAALEQGHLLREANGHDALPPSVLDGAYFETMIDEVLDGIRTPVGARQPVTLFVTATAVGSAEQRYADNYGRPFLVADHRRLYRFRSDPRRFVYDVHRHTAEAHPLAEFDDFASELSKAARASASFPGAFAAVRELETMAGPPLRVLPRQAGTPSWLIDGGVLDNAPFGPVLDSIARRPVTGRVRRVLMYVVPTRGTPPVPPEQDSAAGEHDSSGQAGSGGPEQQPPEPLDAPAVVQLAAAGFTYPREVDFRDDVDQLDELLSSGDASEPENVELFGRMLADPSARDELLMSADGLLASYRRGRVVGVLAELRAATASSPNGASSDGSSVRQLAGVNDVPADPALAAGPAWIDPALGSVAHLTAQPWWWGTAPAERCVRLFVRQLRTRLAADLDPALTSAVAEVSDHLSELEAIRDAVQDAMSAAPIRKPAEVAASVDDMNVVLRELAVPAAVGERVEAAARAFAAGASIDLPPKEVVRAAFAVEVLSRGLRSREPYRRAASFEFLRVGPDVEMPVCGIDTARGLEIGDTKLYGLRAGHFAAFGKREWRRWDWLCGRLDAVTHLGQMLGLAAAEVVEVQRAVLASEGVGESEVADRLDVLERTSNVELLRELHSEPAGREAMERFADEVFGVAAGIRDPHALGRVGRTAAVLGRSRPLPGMHGWERVGRVLLGGTVRRRMWSWTKG